MANWHLDQMQVTSQVIFVSLCFRVPTFGRSVLGVFYKYGLFRITAFSVVGIVIIVSTQLLRGQDPTAAIGKISHFIRSATGLAQDPTSSAAPAVSDAQVNGDALQPNMSIASASPALAQTLTFAADQARPPLPAPP